MAEGNIKPLLNPILSLLAEPKPSSVNGGGKSAKGIVISRLEEQQEKLARDLKKINKDESIKSKAGRLHLLVKMFPDSYAPSWTPNDLFDTDHSVRIVAPAYNGYLVEVAKSKIQNLIDKVSNPKSATVKVDISRLDSIVGFDKREILRSNELDIVYENAKQSGYQFNIWMLPFFDKDARLEVYDDLMELISNEDISFGDSQFDNIIQNENVNFIAKKFDTKIKKYLVDGVLSFTAKIESKDSFEKIVSSGAVYRIDPVVPVSTRSVPPGDGVEPTPKITNKNEIPTVVIVDGGCSASSYLPLNVLNIKPLISNFDADQKHGNQVTSIVCQGHAWNNNLSLPDLECNFISVQAINKKGIKIQPTTEQFINYLRGVAESTRDISFVWNLSFNEGSPNYSIDEISYLGHEINKIAREYNILPVISIGNVDNVNPTRLCPPADCESALTISGRLANKDGLPDQACPHSLRGPAPGGMKKPELSWFSTLRMIGGTVDTGTSFSTPLVSTVAAHTFKNLKQPNPDLVKALLINKAESHAHDIRLGWGTPWDTGKNLPWLCEAGSVTLAWSAKIKAGFAYYWNDIPLPPEMIENGQIKGEIVLTAILRPLVSELGGENYFSTRLQCALQSVSNDGKIKNILGSMKESNAKEIDSRRELAKWSPIRHHAKIFSGVSIDNLKLRLHARIYTRDLYQFGMSSHHELDEQDVSFVLTLKSHKKDPSIYNSMKVSLGTDVDVATIDNNIDIDNKI